MKTSKDLLKLAMQFIDEVYNEHLSQPNGDSTYISKAETLMQQYDNFLETPRVKKVITFKQYSITRDKIIMHHYDSENDYSGSRALIYTEGNHTIAIPCTKTEYDEFAATFEEHICQVEKP